MSDSLPRWVQPPTKDSAGARMHSHTVKRDESKPGVSMKGQLINRESEICRLNIVTVNRLHGAGDMFQPVKKGGLNSYSTIDEVRDLSWWEAGTEHG